MMLSIISTALLGLRHCFERYCFNLIFPGSILQYIYFRSAPWYNGSLSKNARLIILFVIYYTEYYILDEVYELLYDVILIIIYLYTSSGIIIF